jgi:hypothetical protein
MQLLRDWNKNFEFHFAKTNGFLNQCKTTSRSYDKSKDNISEIGFNVFKITSDLYYRENFHSDIIKALLDPREKHFQNTKYLYLFFKLLNKAKKSIVINEDNYKNAKVVREQSKIDILITDETSKRAIIIENKINNAIDMNRQLPRYFNEVKKDYHIDAIVYLTLDSSKRPDKNDWTKEEQKSIENLLVIIPSFDRNDRPNIYANWLLPAIIESNDVDSSYLIRQYANLLKYLNTNYMDTVSLESFYETLKENDNLKTAISIKNMLNDLPEYLAIRIEDKYKSNCYPFQKIWRYQKSDTVFEAFEMENLYLKIDVWCGESGYKAFFWNPRNENYDIKEDFKDIDILKNLENDNGKKNSIVKQFMLFEEDLLYAFIDELINVLKKKITNG